jgi:hypothetical protein
MGHREGKSQAVFYLSPDLHKSLRLQSARTGQSMSDLVESALRAHGRSAAPRRPIPRDRENARPEVVEALVSHGAPLWGRGDPTRLSLEEAVAGGLALARRHPVLLHVLPAVLHGCSGRMSLPALRSCVGPGGLPALGMLLDLTAEVTGSTRLRRWAREIRRACEPRDPPELFFEGARRGARYLEVARRRTPEVARRWGFLMATPLDDFAAAARKFCPGSTERT